MSNYGNNKIDYLHKFEHMGKFLTVDHIAINVIVNC